MFRTLDFDPRRFFRDSRACAALADRVIADLIAKNADHGDLRVWVPGCAAGEEVYTIAILVREQLVGANASMTVKIYGSDIDPAAVDLAGTGLYPGAIRQHVSPQRLLRWFDPDGDNYRVVPEVREMCVFAVQDVMDRAPAADLDLISCRDLLVSFDAARQSRVLAGFHHALRNQGYLFADASADADRFGFTAVDGDAGIFRAEPVASAGPTAGMELAYLKLFSHHASGIETYVKSPPAGDAVMSWARMLNRCESPAYIVVDELYHIISFSPAAGRYVYEPPVEPDVVLSDVLNSALWPPVEAAVLSVAAEPSRPARAAVDVTLRAVERRIEIFVGSMALNDSRYFYISFHDFDILNEGDRSDWVVRDDKVILRLKSQLQILQSRLDSVVSELYRSNEEMKSAILELQSVNEILNASNVELDASREELQAVNAQVELVNTDLGLKISGLERANDDYQKLLENIPVAVVFLDKQLRIRSFTHEIYHIYSLIPSDVGRPITDMVSFLRYDQIQTDVTSVVETLAMVERELSTVDGRGSYVVRMLPHRNRNDKVTGVVLTFFNISDRARQIGRLTGPIAEAGDAGAGDRRDGLEAIYVGGD